MKPKIMLWDRQDKKLYPMKERNVDEDCLRVYYKHKNCNLWLENGVALDVFIINKEGALVPIID